MNPYILNSLLRKIIINQFNDNQSEFAREVKTTKQDIYNYYNNRKKLTLFRFQKWTKKCGWSISIDIEKK